MVEFEHLKTAWKTWKKCPALFQYLFIENNPPSDSIEMQFGQTFHEFADTFFKAVVDEDLLKCTTLAQTVELFEIQGTDQPVVQQWIQNFFAFEAARWLYCRQNYPNPIEYWKPIATEKKIRFNELGLIHVDRIQRYDKQSLMVCEYKTGKTFDISDLRSELTLYCIGINKYGGFTLPCLWLAAYNPQLNVSFLERVTQRATSAVWYSLQKFKAEVDNGNFPYKPSFFCRWCPRLQKCIDEKVFENGGTRD
jgi:hypothetical protein